MALNKDFLMGFVSGTVVGAVGYRLYEQNGDQLKSLIQQAPQQAASMAQGLGGGFSSMAEPSMEELMEQKERLEDLIAEQQSTEA